MASPKNEAFIDLEESLTGKLVREWNKSVSKTLEVIERAIKNKDWEFAHKMADTLNFESVNRNTKLIDTIGAAAVVLGASRHEGEVEDSGVVAEFPQEAVENSTALYLRMMHENATEAVKLMAHITIESIHQKKIEDAEVIEKSAVDFNLTATVSRMGDDMFALASNMTVSRLNTFGFMVEASMRGITTYQIDEVLDSRTCPVCQIMHGQTFEVSTALGHTQMLLNTSDPDALKGLAPWPKQDKASVSKLGKMNPQDMTNAGFDVPPYHPRCRGIVTVAGTVTETTTNQSKLGDNAFFFSGLKRPTNITNMLFGDQTALDLEAKALLGVNAGGSGAVLSSDFLVGVAIGITVEEIMSQGYTQAEAEAIYRDSGGI